MNGPLHTSFLPDDRYALHYWARKGNAHQVEILLNRNSEFKNALDPQNRLPFHHAAKGGHIQLLEALKPADVNARCHCGKSALHHSAAAGHVEAVNWLLSQPQVAVDARDTSGNTPLHFAVLLGNTDVVRLLVGSGANMCRLNNDTDKVMPVSYCQDREMFEACFPSTVRAQHIDTRDSNRRTLLHYAAQYAHSESMISPLICMAEDHHLLQHDIQGDTFLHIAAKAGNVVAIRALKSSGFRFHRPELQHRYSGLTPVLFALFQNQKGVFDEILEVGAVEITLETIIRGLIRELSEIDNTRLALLAATLPTYLALYAKKDLAFDIMLSRFQEIQLSINQWDDEYMRTCLHWAVVDKRKDIVEKLLKNMQVRPALEDTQGKTAQQHAFELRDHEIIQVLVDRADFKAYEEKQYRDREVYAQALNAVLVGAVLIASVTFAGWLQLPSKDYESASMKVFSVSDSLAFFFAMATVSVGIGAFLPTPKKYIGEIVKEVRLAIVSAAMLLALTLAMVLCAFSAAGYAAIPQYKISMSITVALGSLIFVCMWLWFFSQLYKCFPSYRSMLHPVLKHWSGNGTGRIANDLGTGSRFGYANTSRDELGLAMTWNLAGGDYQRPGQQAQLMNSQRFDIHGFIDSWRRDQPQEAPPLLDVTKARNRLKTELFQEDQS